LNQFPTTNTHGLRIKGKYLRRQRKSGQRPRKAEQKLGKRFVRPATRLFTFSLLFFGGNCGTVLLKLKHRQSEAPPKKKREANLQLPLDESPGQL